MEFEWDDAKAAGNLEKHGMSFEVVRDMDWLTCPILDDARFDYGEARYIAYARASTGLRYVVASRFAPGVIA